MARDIVLPQWGMGMEEGIIVKWIKAEGDVVSEGEAIAEIETSKINSELESPASGILAYIVAAEGETVKVGSLIAVVTAPGEKVERPVDSKMAQKAKPEQVSAPTISTRSQTGGQVTPTARRLAQQEGVDLDRLKGTGPGGRITEADVRKELDTSSQLQQTQVVPAARKLAKERGVDLNQVKGSGNSGRITLKDVEDFINDKPTPIGQGVQLRGMRKIIADRMLQSVRTMAQVTLTTEADVTDLEKLRQKLLGEWRPHRLRPMDQDMINMATVKALKEHSSINALLIGDEVFKMDHVDLGVAMAVPDGLLVPVVKKAEEKSLLQIALEVRELARKSRDSALLPEEMANPSFTITNLGSYDIDAFTPIINPPQVAILGVGRIVEKPVVLEGEIAIRSTIVLSLTFDHRALDGVPAGEFLRDIKRFLEDPHWMVSS